MVYQECDIEYANQVTAEHKVQVKKGEELVQRWELKASHTDNHYLDCEVYAFAAADIMGVRMLHLQDTPDPPHEQPKSRTLEEEWISENESWL